MEKARYANLIRYAMRQHDKDADVDEWDDDALIYYYENSLWGAAHNCGLAAGAVVHAFGKFARDVLNKRLNKSEGSG